MRKLRYTLLSDGSSDQALIPLLTWLLQKHGISSAIQPRWAELRWLRQPPGSLVARIQYSLELYPCDLLFIHRDAESEAREVRVAQIRQALEDAALQEPCPAICVVPVRMQEAWLLFDEAALRRAAGNPNGRQQLRLPHLAGLEQLPDPKNVLYELLREASGLSGRRRKRFSVSGSARQVAGFINDFTLLRRLSAFRALETDLDQLINERGWAD